MTIKNLYLSGGGAHGAFQAGAIYELYQCGKLENLQLVSGISVGAINGLLTASGYAEQLPDIWKGSGVGLISYFNKITSPFRAMFRGHLLDPSPLLKMIRPYLETGPYINFQVGVTSLEDGQFYLLNSKTLDKTNLEKAVIASASQPGIMPPVSHIQTTELTNISLAADGGILNPIYVPKECPESLAIYSAPSSLSYFKGSGLLSILSRYQDLQRYEIRKADLPNTPLIQPGYLPYKQTDFSKEAIDKNIALGRKYALEFLELLE